MNQLPIPEAAVEDEKSIEMIRVWIAQRKLHASLRPGIYHGREGVSETRAWGIVLADVARHVASALGKEFGLDTLASVEAIEAAFLNELREPSSPLDGAFVRKH